MTDPTIKPGLTVQPAAPTIKQDLKVQTTRICEACGETFQADAPGAYRDPDGVDLCPGDAAHLFEHAAMETAFQERNENRRVSHVSADGSDSRLVPAVSVHLA